MKKLFCFLLLALVCADNPFYVDKNSIKKEEYKWTMKLINRKAESEGDSAENKPIKEAAATIESLDRKVLHLKIVDANNQRWEPPVLNPVSGANYRKAAMSSMGFELVEDPFAFRINDPEGREGMVDMTQGSFDFKDKYLEIGMVYNGERIMGLGERVTEKLFLCHNREDCSYTSWGKDVASPFDDGSGGCRGSYAQQSFYMIQLPSKKFMGVFMLSSNDHDVIMQRRSGRRLLIHKMIGGVFDFYFFYPGNAESVVQTYHEFIGRPYLPPLWSMGYHQCRYGWRNLAKVKDVVNKFEQSDLPLDVVWADIDYMKNYVDFTVDPERYGGLGEFVNELHSKKMRWVPIIDAGLKYDINDKYYKLGEANNAFVKSAFTKKTLIAAVWPGSAVFLSWYAPYSPILWKIGLEDLYQMVKFDGIWLDMNEIASFCRGECPPKMDKSMLRRTLAADNHDPKEFDDLPYRPGWCDPVDKTISLTGYHHSTNDFEDRTRKEYNTHSLWNLYEGKATHEFLAEKLKQRPYVLTRSNFPGSGLFVTKWLGDNFSRWEYLRYSIVGIYDFQLFGIPLTGSDMCGFMDNTNEELCGRWMQLGAFYPFTRNHNDIHSGDQEPYVFGERVIKATKNAMRQKYSIMMYYYTKLFEVSLNGGTLVRPLFFHYPNDDKVYDKTEMNFMIGESLLVVPVLYSGTNKAKAYLPNENWYNLKTFRQVASYKDSETYGGEQEFTDDFDFVNVLIKGGSVLPYQDAHIPRVRRIDNLKSLQTQLLIAPGHDGKGKGTWVIDDGISLDTIKDKKYTYLSFDFSMNDKTLTVNKLNNWDGNFTRSDQVNQILIFGAEKWASIKNACVIGENGKVSLKGSYDTLSKNLLFSGPSGEINWKDVKTVKFGENC